MFPLSSTSGDHVRNFRIVLGPFHPLTGHSCALRYARDRLSPLSTPFIHSPWPGCSPGHSYPGTRDRTSHMGWNPQLHICTLLANCVPQEALQCSRAMVTLPLKRAWKIKPKTLLTSCTGWVILIPYARKDKWFWFWISFQFGDVRTCIIKNLGGRSQISTLN